MDDFYKEYILDHYRNPRNFGHLEHPTAKAEDLNPLCGDKISMELSVGPDGKVDDVLENVGIGISPTRMKCAMLGLKVAKSAALGEIATWPDEAAT